jgi:hypothetical protein
MSSVMNVACLTALEDENDSGGVIFSSTNTTRYRNRFLYLPICAQAQQIIWMIKLISRLTNLTYSVHLLLLTQLSFR